MLEEEALPNIPELLRHHLAIVLRVNGSDPNHWRIAQSLHYIARRVIERHYFQQDRLLFSEESQLFTALEELHECPVQHAGEPSTWWQVQLRLRRVMPLVERLLTA